MAKYTNPNFVNDSAPALNEANLNELANAVENLTVPNGGTGKSTFALDALLAGNGEDPFKEITGTGAVYNQGDDLRFGTLPINCGGTGATTPQEAVKNLGINADIINTYICTTTNNTVQLTNIGGGPNIKFVADADCPPNPVIIVNGATVATQYSNGLPLSAGAWVAGAIITCFLNNEKTELNFKMPSKGGEKFGLGYYPDGDTIETRQKYLFGASEFQVPTYDAPGETKYRKLNYNSWKPILNAIFKPCMLKTNGEVDYYLDPNDTTKKLDGTPSDISNPDYDGNAMVEVNGFYKWTTAITAPSVGSEFPSQETIFSTSPLDETSFADAFKNESGIVQDKFYWGMFKGSLVNGRLRSLANRDIMINQSTEAEIQYAKANGIGYNISYLSGRLYMESLFKVIMKDAGKRSVPINVGYAPNDGWGTNVTAPIKTGTTSQEGMFANSVNTWEEQRTSDNKIFYVEGMQGNVWEALNGLYFERTTKTPKYKMFPPYNLSGIGYIVPLNAPLYSQLEKNYPVSGTQFEYGTNPTFVPQLIYYENYPEGEYTGPKNPEYSILPVGYGDVDTPVVYVGGDTYYNSQGGYSLGTITQPVIYRYFGTADNNFQGESIFYGNIKRYSGARLTYIKP